MKKVFVMMCMLLGGGLFCACSSDDSTNDEQLSMYAHQKVKTINNHPGILRYDGDSQKWYIENLSNKPANITERFYSDDLTNYYQEEGLPIVFSGNIYDFRHAKNTGIPNDNNDYYLSLLDIAESDHLLPLQNIEPEIAKFLDEAMSITIILGGKGTMACQFDFPGSTLEEMFTDTCFVINDQVQLAAFYTGQETIPVIDFSKYTLIIGRAQMPSSGETLVYHDISADKKTVNLYIGTNLSGGQILNLEYYWALYPKFEGDQLICNRKISTFLKDVSFL